MVVLRNGRFLCRGRGCHTVYEAKDVIDPENEDYGLYVRA
jgi:ribosome biogenesis protein Nip4